MKRTIVTVLPALNEEHRAQIAAAAEKRGFEALFFDTVDQALPALREA